MGEAEEIVTTGVDSLIELLRSKKLVSLEEAAKVIKVREVVLQNWVDFLVEEGIIGVEYKFITPYIFLRTDEKQSALMFDTKEEFYQKAASRHIDPVKTLQLWQAYLAQNLPTIKQEFFRKLEQRRIVEAKWETLWAKYEQHLRGDLTSIPFASPVPNIAIPAPTIPSLARPSVANASFATPVPTVPATAPAAARPAQSTQPIQSAMGTQSSPAQSSPSSSPSIAPSVPKEAQRARTNAPIQSVVQ